MRAFAEAWPSEEFVQQVAAQLPWGHNTHLLDALKVPTERAVSSVQTRPPPIDRGDDQVEAGITPSA